MQTRKSRTSSAKPAATQQVTFEHKLAKLIDPQKAVSCEPLGEAFKEFYGVVFSIAQIKKALTLRSSQFSTIKRNLNGHGWSAIQLGASVYVFPIYYTVIPGQKSKAQFIADCEELLNQRKSDARAIADEKIRQYEEQESQAGQPEVPADSKEQAHPQAVQPSPVTQAQPQAQEEKAPARDAFTAATAAAAAAAALSVAHVAEEQVVGIKRPRPVLFDQSAIGQVPNEGQAIEAAEDERVPSVQPEDIDALHALPEDLGFSAITGDHSPVIEGRELSASVDSTGTMSSFTGDHSPVIGGQELPASVDSTGTMSSLSYLTVGNDTPVSDYTATTQADDGAVVADWDWMKHLPSEAELAFPNLTSEQAEAKMQARTQATKRQRRQVPSGSDGYSSELFGSTGTHGNDPLELAAGSASYAVTNLIRNFGFGSPGRVQQVGRNEIRSLRVAGEDQRDRDAIELFKEMLAGGEGPSF